VLYNRRRSPEILYRIYDMHRRRSLLYPYVYMCMWYAYIVHVHIYMFICFEYISIVPHAHSAYFPTNGNVIKTRQVPKKLVIWSGQEQHYPHWHGIHMQYANYMKYIYAFYMSQGFVLFLFPRFKVHCPQPIDHKGAESREGHEVSPRICGCCKMTVINTS